LEQISGHPPTAEELSIEIEENPQRIRWMLDVSRVPLSLDNPLGNEEVPELGAFVEDLQTPTPPQVVQESVLRERLEEILLTLSPREARILRLRFGLDDNQPLTLEEVGAKFGLTRERIRQIEVGALRRLRHPCHKRGLGDYL
jgi:RNA polymerase primary sigma factor